MSGTDPFPPSFCSNCGTAGSSSDKFCGECGSPSHPTGATPPFGIEEAAETAQAAPPSTSQPTRRRVRPTLLVGILLGVLIAIGGGFLLSNRATKHGVVGSITLASYFGGEPCVGNSGFDDIHGGTEVRVKDGSGKTIAVGELTAGYHLGTGCIFAFKVNDVPDAAVYEVSIGNADRHGPQFTKLQMSAMNWAVALTLGG